MTQEQYKWLKDNGYDPTVHDVDDQGNIFENPINQPQQKEVMSPLRAGLTSFAGNLLPSAAGLYAGAQTGALGGSMFGLPGTIIGGIGGGLAGGYGAGKLQEKALEEFAPGAAEEIARAQRDQPVASYAGGFLPNALALKPSFGGIKGLAAPLMGMEKEAARAAFTPAALNVGANVAGSTAGQLLDMSQGGEFSAPRFAADVALGSIFSDPNKLGRKFGLQALKPDVAAPEQAMDLGALRTANTEAREAARVAGETEDARIMDQTRGQMAAGGMTGREVEMFKTRPEMEWWKQPEAARINDIQNVAKQVKQRMPKGMAAELAGLPEVYDVVQNPEKFPAFLANSLETALDAAHERGVQNKFLSPEDLAMQEKSLARRSGRDLPTETPLSDVTEAYKNYRRNVKEREEVSQRFMGAEERADIARMDETKRKLATQKASPEYRGEQMGAFREGAEAFTPEGGSRVAPKGWPPEVARPTRAAVTTEEILGRQSQAAKADEGISLEQALKPTPAEVAKADKIQADIARVFAKRDAVELRKLQDLDAAQALNEEAAARLQSLQAKSSFAESLTKESAPDIAQAKQELADARAIADDLYSRLQSAGGKGLLNQADLDAATKLAAQRGLRIVPATPEQQAKGIRGAYVVNENGERVIYINPLAATADTAIHEIGHDVFKTSPNERMSRSLMDTAEGSEAYKREYEARIKEGKNEQQARDIALEEGLVQAFGEAYPNAKPGEIRQWFNALKSSVKSMVGMKLSPEDALAWMHYATTEAVPWKGVAAVKTGDVGEERMQRALESDAAYLKAVESGDMETAQRMVNEAAKAAGYNEGPLYHVGQSSWTEADRPVYTQDSKELADKFLKSLRRDYPEAQAMKLYAQMENPALQGRDIERSSFLTSSELGKEQLSEAMGKGFDSVKGYYAGLGVPEYLTTKPNQIKLADPVTRDNAGNVIPLSERFNKQSNDIRYQRAQQETPEFKNWFGESKVVDAEGKPLVMYHGTRSPQDFNTFRTDSGHNYGPGAYFTPEARRASGYAGEQEGARVYSTYVSVEKPYTVQSDATIQDLGYKLRQDPANDALIQKLLQKYNSTDKNILGNAEVGNAWLREQGYDGIIKQRNRYTEDGYVPEVVEVVAFNPEQVKSATANKGTFDPLNKDIRYQRSVLEKIQTPSEMDALIKQGGPFERVGSTIRDASNTRDYKQGEWSSKYSLATKLRPEDQVRLFNHLAQEFDAGVRSNPAAELKPAYDQLRNEYLPAIVNDYNAQGFTVRDTAGQRARGTNPTYIPLHAIADEVKAILTTKQGSPEYTKLENDFKQWNTQLRQADGATLQEAQRYANDKFEEKLQITAKTPGIESGIPFSGARKPEGYPLPPTWRSDDLIGNLDNYTKRSATDFAYQKHVESSPEAMAALGAKTMVNNQPIPANILASTPSVINNDSVQSVLREYRGTPAQKTDGMLAGIGRSVSAATIGPVSKVGDIGTSLIKGLVYMPAGEYTSGLVDFTNRLGDWAALKERSYASGLNKRDAAQNMRQVLGIAEDSVGFMDKVARVISKGTGLNQLESVARTVAQAWGETVVKYNKTLALGGDKSALKMLDTMSPDWRTRSDADLAAQVGRLLQGSYDMRQLPASVLEGAAAPYLTWSKWSIGQYDSFVKYAIKPAMQGNVKPLIGQMLIGVLGGGAVGAVQEWLNNREGKDISWNELESWMQQNQGQLGADGGQLLAQKLLTMTQKLGTFGFAGDIAKMSLDAASGGSAQGVATMPALDAIYDVSKRAAAAAKALDDGEDFGLVMQALLKDSVIGHMQVARVARNWLDEDENMRYDDRRRRRLYDELIGAPSKGGAFAVNYSNLSERKFERGEITPKTGEEAMSLVSRARTEATSPEDYASRIRKLKTSQNAIMPSMERQPMKAARYLNFVEGAETGKGSETMRRYMIRENEDAYRKSLIEGLSGIR
jgi:hypothetical protein